MAYKRVVSGFVPDLKQYPMTLVIATLGGDTLKNAIETINHGTIIPDEILICIPRNEVFRIADFSFPNVRVLITSRRGQVAQRAIGFQNATYDVVMQLDDDILLDAFCIERLLETLKAYGPNVAVAPAFISMATGKSVYEIPGRNRILEKLYYWFRNGSAGYQQGKIDKVGVPVGVVPKGEHERIFNVEWLAGGCVLHHKKNLVLENFYPFEGKAYYEDIIHSHYLKKKGVRLMVDSMASCFLEPIGMSTYGPRKFFSNLMLDFRARKYFIRLSSRVCLRMYLFYVAVCLNYVCKRLVGYFKNMKHHRNVA